jgi:hypothetical protein
VLEVGQAYVCALLAVPELRHTLRVSSGSGGHTLRVSSGGHTLRVSSGGHTLRVSSGGQSVPFDEGPVSDRRE